MLRFQCGDAWDTAAEAAAPAGGGRGAVGAVGAWVVAGLMMLAGCSGEEPRAAAASMAAEGPARRVVALEWTYAEDLLALDVEPVGVADPEGYRQWVVPDPPLPDAVASVGTRQEPSLEAIVQLQPDLILGTAYRQAPVRDTLEAIAPTLLFDAYNLPQGQTQYAEMRDTFTAIAEAVGRTDRADQVLAQLDAAIADARQHIEQLPPPQRRFILVQTFTAKNAPVLRIFTDQSMAVQILEAMGLQNAWSSDVQQYGFSTVGLDALLEVGDAHLFYVAQSDDDPLGKELRGHPVWRQLPMVRQDKVHPLGGDAWLFGGPISAKVLVQRVMDVLEGERP